MFFRKLQKKVHIKEHSVQRVSHAALSVIQAQEERINQLEMALQVIVGWNTHSLELAANQGSNGVRDYYRYIAATAIENNEGTK